jgi:hypothetical protein
MVACKSKARKGSLFLGVFKINQARGQGQHGAGDNFATVAERFA